MSSDCTPGIACDKFSPAPLWPRKIAALLNKISLICKKRYLSVFRVFIVSGLTGSKIMPKKESAAQSRKRRAQFETSLNECKKFVKEYFASSDNAKRQSADMQRQDEFAEYR